MQKKIGKSAFDNRRSVVQSSHGVGKTFLMACITLAFLALRSPAKVITTAPTMTQVENVLWKEINNIYRTKMEPIGYNWTALQRMLKIDSESFAVGISPARPTNAQGYHQKNIMVIVDEAPGVDLEIINSLNSLTSSGNAHTMWIGNPIEPSGHFYDACLNPSFKRHHINAFMSPNFTNENVPPEVAGKLVDPIWVEELRDEWGEDSPQYISKVLGEFPPAGINQLIELAQCNAAVEREVLRMHDDETYMGVDVARMGDDRTVYMVCKGYELVFIDDDAKGRTTETVGKSLKIAERFGVDEIRVDGIAVGAGVVDGLHERGAPVVDVQAASTDVSEPNKYFNKRAEMWFNAKQWIEFGKIPDDRRLIRDLTAPQFKFRTDGTFQIESKDDIKKRLGRSPDFGDAFVMATPRYLGPIVGSQPPAMAEAITHSNEDIERRMNLGRNDNVEIEIPSYY